MYIYDWMNGAGELQFDLPEGDLSLHPCTKKRFPWLALEGEYARAHSSEWDHYSFFVFVPIAWED